MLPSKKTLAALGMIACGVVLVRCGDDDDEDEIKQPTESAAEITAALTTGSVYGLPVSFNPEDLHRR